MRGLVSLTIGLVALVAFPFAGLGAGPGETAPATDEDETGSDTSVGDTMSKMLWSTTKGGDRVIRLTLEFPSQEMCGFRIVSAGWQDPSSLYQFTSHERTNGGWTAVADQQILHAHSANVAVRFGGLPGNAWIAEAQHGFLGIGTITFLYAGFDLIPIDHPISQGKSIQFHLECTGPFTIKGLEGGSNVVGATPGFLTGGAGGSLFGVSANVADRMSHLFNDPTTLFRMRTDSHFQAGHLQVRGPNGVGGQEILFADSHIDHDGTSGRWNILFTRAAHDVEVDTAGTQAVALLAGLQDVQSLDEAADL